MCLLTDDAKFAEAFIAVALHGERLRIPGILNLLMPPDPLPRDPNDPATPWMETVPLDPRPCAEEILNTAQITQHSDFENREVIYTACCEVNGAGICSSMAMDPNTPPTIVVRGYFKMIHRVQKKIQKKLGVIS